MSTPGNKRDARREARLAAMRAQQEARRIPREDDAAEDESDGIAAAEGVAAAAALPQTDNIVQTPVTIEEDAIPYVPDPLPVAEVAAAPELQPASAMTDAGVVETADPAAAQPLAAATAPDEASITAAETSIPVAEAPVAATLAAPDAAPVAEIALPAAEAPVDTTPPAPEATRPGGATPTRPTPRPTTGAGARTGTSKTPTRPTTGTSTPPITKQPSRPVTSPTPGAAPVARAGAQTSAPAAAKVAKPTPTEKSVAAGSGAGSDVRLAGGSATGASKTPTRPTAMGGGATKPPISPAASSSGTTAANAASPMAAAKASPAAGAAARSIASPPAAKAPAAKVPSAASAAATTSAGAAKVGGTSKTPTQPQGTARTAASAAAQAATRIPVTRTTSPFIEEGEEGFVTKRDQRREARLANLSRVQAARRKRIQQAKRRELAIRAAIVAGVLILALLIGLIIHAVTTPAAHIQPVGPHGYVYGSGLTCDTATHATRAVADLQIIVAGKAEAIPANVGVNGGCRYWLDTVAPNGVITVAPPASAVSRTFYLGDFIAVWAKTPHNSIAAGSPALTANDFFGKTIDKAHPLAVFVDGKTYTGDPNQIVLTDHETIWLEYGTPQVPTAPYPFS